MSDDPFDNLPDEAPLVEVLPRPELQLVRGGLAKPKETGVELLKVLEDELHEQSLEVVRDVLRFRDIDPASEEVPPAWIRKFGAERATQMFRSARMGLMSAKDAPVGIKVAMGMSSAGIKARAASKQGPQVLNMTLVEMTVEAPKYPEKEVER